MVHYGGEAVNLCGWFGWSVKVFFLWHIVVVVVVKSSVVESRRYKVCNIGVAVCILCCT